MRPAYQLVRINGRVLYRYPPGGSVLSLPFVAILNAAGLSAIDKDGEYNPSAERRLQKLIASIATAATVVAIFMTAMILLPVSWSLVLAIAAATGTQFWSSASRALYSHTWEIFLAALVILELLRAEERREAVRPILLATLTAWLYFTRPTGALAIVAVTVFVLLFYRSGFVSYAVTGVVWGGLFLLFFWMTFGAALPDYYRLGSRLDLASLPAVLAAVLISPSRGLFVFVPSALFVIYLVLRYWQELPYRRLALLAIAIIAANVLVVSCWPVWWGGGAYGPRLLTDIVPWLALLGILGLRAILDHDRAGAGTRHSDSFKLTLAVGAALTLAGIAINCQGAIARKTRTWNKQVDINHHPERVWDWRYPQFMAGIITPPTNYVSPDVTTLIHKPHPH